jgi:hypothetical protein
VYSLPTDLSTVFTVASPEAIWQLQPTQTSFSAVDANIFVLPETGPADFSFPVYMSDDLASSFDPGDQRRSIWVDSVIAGGNTYHYAHKYTNTDATALTEAQVVLRLAEQYLIRAEALARQGDLDGATADLNVLRTRAGLPDLAVPADLDTFLDLALTERRHELFAEYGHRWLDLKRLGAIDAVMTAYGPSKGVTWNTDWQWLPLSQTELQRGVNLRQNKGY